MAIRKIIEYPEPLLRLKAKKVDVFDDELKILTEDMAETMWEAPGIGLAAPQVAQSLRVIVVDITEPGEEKKHLALVNPEIVEHEGSQLDAGIGSRKHQCYRAVPCHQLSIILVDLL